MIRIAVLCSRADCRGGERVPTMGQKKLKKYLSNRLWIVKNGNAFCGELCYSRFVEDKKFQEIRAKRNKLVCIGKEGK